MPALLLGMDRCLEGSHWPAIHRDPPIGIPCCSRRPLPDLHTRVRIQQSRFGQMIVAMDGPMASLRASRSSAVCSHDHAPWSRLIAGWLSRDATVVSALSEARQPYA